MRSNPKKSIARNRVNILLERDQSYPIWTPNRNITINKSYRYTPKPIQNRIIFNTQKNRFIYL